MNVKSEAFRLQATYALMEGRAMTKIVGDFLKAKYPYLEIIDKSYYGFILKDHNNIFVLNTVYLGCVPRVSITRITVYSGIAKSYDIIPNEKSISCTINKEF